MRTLPFIIVLLYTFIEDTTGQKVFTQTDLKGSYDSFDGSGCAADTRQHDSSKKKYFRYLQQSFSNPKMLYVGAMNNVYKINMSNMKCLNYNESKPSNNTIRRCYIQGKERSVECQNHIRVVMELGGGLLVCGTGGYSPIRFQLNEKLEINETFNGVAYCPFDPWDNYTAILVRQGNPGNEVVPYFGTYTDFIKSSPVFYRPKFEGANVSYSEKTTDREEINWLNYYKSESGEDSPQFVGSFDDDEKVMFFFRETAVENVDRNVIYSRVGKVCKQDLGGGYADVATKKEWLSFQKARLICSLPGNRPHFFDDIYDVYERDGLFYAVFFKQKEYDEDNVASAVCVYSKSDIEEVFRGKFQTKTSDRTWAPLSDSQNPNPRLDNCTLHKTDPDIFNKKSSSYQLMAESVKPVYGKPIWYKTGVQIIRIAVSETQNDSDTTGKNIYLATDEGEIYDLFMKTNEATKTFLVENKPTIYRPFTSRKNRDYAIWSMKIVNNSLVMGTDFNVTRFNVEEVCGKIQQINVCVANTRCQWKKCNGSCVKKSDSTGDCAVLDWRDITSSGIIVSLKDEIQGTAEKTLGTVAGTYFTVPYMSKIFTDDIIWYNSENCAGINVLQLDPEKYAISSTNDLVIKNLTQEVDHDTRYSVCYQGRETLKLEGYKITVAKEKDEIIAVWKQQFNEWSSAFVKWKGCASHYYDSCGANGGG